MQGNIMISDVYDNTMSDVIYDTVNISQAVNCSTKWLKHFKSLQILYTVKHSTVTLDINIINKLSETLFHEAFYADSKNKLLHYRNWNNIHDMFIIFR